MLSDPPRPDNTALSRRSGASYDPGAGAHRTNACSPPAENT